MIKITALSHDGRGVARVDGKTVFVVGALPNETVTIRYYKRHKNFDEAVCEQVLEPASDRVSPRCPHFSVCGGCSLQHLSSEAQRQHKQSVLLEQLQHFGQIESAFTSTRLDTPLYDESPWGYRYRARLSVRYSEKKAMVYVGFRERTRSQWITDMQTCDILMPAVGEHIQALRELVNALDMKKQIPQIEIAAGNLSPSGHGCALIFRHLVPLSATDREKLIQFGRQYHYEIISQPAGIDSLVWLLPENPEQLFYKLCLSEKTALTFFFHPTHFTQVNPRMNQKLVQRVLELLQPASHEVVLDLFCGLGNFSLPLAQYAKQVVGIEGSEMMVQQARDNAAYNLLDNVDFYTADLSKITETLPAVLPEILQSQYDKILLDPPRAGALAIVQMIDQWQPKTIVYVSCNPATLARDAGVLMHQKGYHLRQIGIADMFPHTSHVESIAVFDRHG